jgi:hypothetical protein
MKMKNKRLYLEKEGEYVHALKNYPFRPFAISDTYQRIG